MGVVVHILDRRTVQLDIAGTVQEIGTLRHLAKVTELDEHRAAELEEAARLPSPPAVMVAHPEELPNASRPDVPVTAHPILGWDEGRSNVTDLGWDYLPVLGYAVRSQRHNLFVLHELYDGLLHPIGLERAAALELLANGALVRRGQPAITACHAVRAFIPEFAEADCVLADGRRDRFIVRIDGHSPPDPSWLVGRKPREVGHYSP